MPVCNSTLFTLTADGICKHLAAQVPGPAAEGAMSLDSRARSIFQYFKNYNYEVAGTGEVIRFVGNYRASRGQAAALVLYTFLGALRRTVMLMHTK